MTASNEMGESLPKYSISAEQIRKNQNTDSALKLLIAQRRMYSRAKKWNNFRLIGVGVIAVAVPITSMVSDKVAVIGLAIAGGWAGLSHIWFARRQAYWSNRGAAVQEAFDTRVFDLPPNPALVDTPRPEWVADVLGDDDVTTVAQSERLKDWYTLGPDLPGAEAVAICQRANFAYSERLLERYAIVLISVAAAWTAVAVAIALVEDLTFYRLLIGVILPIVPAAIDAHDEWAKVHNGAKDRGRTASEIDRRVRESHLIPLTVSDIRSFQDEVYGSRRDSPLVPDAFYDWKRAENERAAKHAADQLRDAVLEHGQRQAEL